MAYRVSGGIEESE
ncbi:Protein of unknown function [Bacillus cereus]|uniref:Uncharacterized protein n=2 Tax=Bacillus cereus group TaxID=86661 RepID=A0A1C3ZAI8_9BACI|nr:Protein of unknown function [Bacillus wiedmannii]SCB80340.1 Protein of unknown function [Bacillus cereus]SCB80605.1 Protein of unknown function [Bacillus thuringiensis]SCB85689.1 Protein of unknown function [Bacillus wiedmannii]SCL83928.1 Protein of unknown function [Bacillus wiedmannii]